MRARFLLPLAGSVLVVARGSAQTLQADIAKQLDGLKARSSIYAKHLPSGKTIEVRADQPMNTLSVIKIAVMIQAFRDAEAGTVKLAERYSIKPEDMRRGSGL